MPKRGFNRKYAYGGTGIFGNIASLLSRIFTSKVARELATNIAKKGAGKALEVGTDAGKKLGTKLVKKVLKPKSKKILEKYTEQRLIPETQNISSLIDGGNVEIQDLVKRLNVGMGIKKIN